MNYKKTLPYIIALGIFIIASLIYFNPVLSGKQIKQSDITQFSGMAKEIKDFRAKNHKEPYWTGSAFSGMPAYQISAYYPNDFIKYIDKAIRFLPRPADYLFLYFFGFFILLIALKVNWKLAILGALSFGFSTYLIIIFGAGHNAKAHAIGFIPIVLAGVLWIFQKRYLLGFVTTSVAMALEIYANHIQMTYYMGFILLILGIIELIEAIQNKSLPLFAKQAGVITLALLLGISVNATRLLATKEYSKYSTRGKSELTIKPDGSPKEKSSGLDKDYITEYSYGIAETFNLMIPRFMGGGTVEKLGKNSNFYKTLEQKVGAKQAKDFSEQVLTYWGKQPIVEAPAYIGAIMLFLFFLGIFLVKGKLKKWLVAATLFSIILSWGKNFSGLTNFFIDYIPLYNKFRAVSSIQVIAEICIPLLGILALGNFFSNKIPTEEKEKALKKALYIGGGIALFFMLFGSSLFAFEGIRDSQYAKLPELIEALIADRKSMLFNDSLRSLLLILLSASLLWLHLKNKLKQPVVIALLGLLILFDLTSVDIKYVNKDDFVTARKVQKPFIASEADKQILEDKTHYRVGNFTANLMQDGRTSYFHQSIGGYNAAKMERYQELFDYQIAKNNIEVLNMLNTKYFIVGADQAQVNPDANGNAWFVQKLKPVTNANQEIKALDSMQTKAEAVYDASKFTNLFKTGGIQTFKKDTTATIQLTKYNVNQLTYQSTSAINQFAVFSEIYYKDGWNAYVDGKLTPHLRVDYVLRGMQVPAGNHTIEFKFEPTVIEKGSLISLIAYAFLVLASVGWFFVKKKNNVRHITSKTI
ncbi:YfhO family protein [Tenacibaculum sp. UWU-22]|uniref:YfhO family protein n=1 Tax=Tenacibaculum sp. UWU-22 TaxID=3234187 RepID=UPI0034DB5F1B